MYDFFSRDGGTVPRHQFRGRKRALAELPRLHPGIKYAATYFDASVHNPERLTLDVLQDGEKAGAAGGSHARASNYVSLVSWAAAAAGTGPGPGTTVQLRDELTGEVFDFTADVVVNTTGAWVDLTNEAMGAASSFMGGTKGSHIVLDHPELLAACNGREIFFEHTDGRIVLIYPMGDRVLVGTTDVDADMAQDAVCTEAEIDYFFDLIGHVFPDIPVGRDRSSTRSPACARCRSTTPPSPASSAGTTGSNAVPAARRRRAQPRRRQMDHVPGPRRAPEQRRPGRTRYANGRSRRRSSPSAAAPASRRPRTASSAGSRPTCRPAATPPGVTGLLTRYGTRAEDVIGFLDGPGRDRTGCCTPPAS